MQNDRLFFSREIYINHLREISGIDFTQRQVDVIACIMSAKKVKGIAEFLSSIDRPIEPTTVNVHISTIRQKIHASSISNIVDFIEKSDKHQIVRDYYLSLLAQREFNRSLQEIIPIIKPYIEACTIISYKENTNNAKSESIASESETIQVNKQTNTTSIITNLANHLKRLGINISRETEQHFTAISALPCFVAEKQLIIHILPLRLNSNINLASSQTSDVNNWNKTTKHSYANILLLLQNTESYTNYKDELTSEPAWKYINISSNQNYYYLFFDLLKKLCPNVATDIAAVGNKLQKRFESISGSYVTDISTTYLKKNIDLKEKVRSLLIFPNKFLYLYALIIIFLTSGSFLALYYNYAGNKGIDNTQNSNSGMTAQDQVNTILPKFFKDLSVRNLTKAEAETNYIIVKQFDQVIEQINSGQIQQYFDVKNLKSDELINCLYNLNAISSYYLFKVHDAKQAEKSLTFAKNLAEDHLLRRSKIKINFKTLTAAELYTEVSSIKDLPEMYTITNYFLGRSFIYQKNIELAKKHFELSRYLGERLGLFDGILSMINGLAIIKGDEIEILIKKRNYEQAKKEIQECINIFKNMRENDKEYKINYRPNNFNPTIIVPKDDIYNVINSNKRILKLYTQLIPIINDVEEKNNCLNAISAQLIGTNKSTGVLELLKKITDNSARIAGDLYNSLGYFLLKLHDEKIDFKQLQNDIVRELNLTNGDDLEIIYQIFDLAKSLSRSTEFSKADAYDGLSEICERMIEQPNITEEEKKSLSIKIREFKDGRDSINKELGRVITKP